MQVAITNAKKVELIATVTRADGTIEELGVIDYYHRNPIKQFIWNLKKFFRRFKWLHY